jgi:ABC-type multidrug transport system fused ATPase/permease subunit
VTAQTWQGQAAPQAEEPDGPSRAEAAMITKRSRRLLADLLGRDRRRAIWTAVLIMVASLAALIGPWLVGLGIDDGIPPLSRDGNAGPLIVLTVAFGVTVAVQALATRSYIYAMGQLGERIVIDLRKRLFAHFQELSVAFHEDYTSGKVISRQTSDIDAITSLFEDGMDSLVSAVVTLVLVGVGMLLLNWQLGLIVLAGFIPLTWLTAWFRRESATTYRRSREAIAQVIVQFVETMTGIRAVQAFRRQPRNDEIFAELNDAYCEATLRSYRLVALYAPAITLVGNVITAGMLCYGGLLVIDGDVKVGVLVTFLLYLRRFFDPLQDLAQFYNSFQGAAAALEKLSGVLAEQPSVPAPAAGATLPGRPGGGRAVTFTGVTFGYSGRPVIEDLNLEIPAGQTTALVGSTGAGKTTVARLLARFYDPDTGRVALDGVDLRELDDPALRTEVVLITQENFLFSGTIADNIRLGRPAADQAEIEAAARAIGAHPFIAALPGGYDADVGKRGGRLSAGQRQLISFARAFLAAPAVLILDEATSLLDIPSERMLQRALQTMLAGRTAVIIAHRLSTVEIADRVLVLDHGRVVQDGPPAELLAGQGRFAQMHQSWRATLA